MGDMLGKMGEVLSDPESMKQLQELAEMLKESEGSSEADSASAAPSEMGSGEEDDSGFDIQMLLRMQELMSAMQNEDDDARLLLALRPHLKTERQKKVDHAVKLLKLYTVFNAAKENGLLKDLL